MTTKKLPRSTQILRERVKKCKVYRNKQTNSMGFIPGLKGKLILIYPEYDTSEGETRIRNVLQGRATDSKLTNSIEFLTAEYLTANKALSNTSMQAKSKAGVAAPAS